MDAFRARWKAEKKLQRKSWRCANISASNETRKTKAAEPSLRDLLSQNFLKAFERDFAEKDQRVAAIKALGEKSPEKYAEIAARLIAATEPQPEGFKAPAACMKSLLRYEVRGA
jgi:hypothetical protein